MTTGKIAPRVHMELGVSHGALDWCLILHIHRAWVGCQCGFQAPKGQETRVCGRAQGGFQAGGIANKNICGSGQKPGKIIRGSTEAMWGLGFFSGKTAGVICRVVTDNHCQSCSVADTCNSSFAFLFLVISIHLKLCWSVGEVKPH